MFPDSNVERSRSAHSESLRAEITGEDNRGEAESMREGGREGVSEGGRVSQLNNQIVSYLPKNQIEGNTT